MLELLAKLHDVFPRATADLWGVTSSGDLRRALLLQWDSQTKFIQATKPSMGPIDRHGGPCRQLRLPLVPDPDKTVRLVTERMTAKGLT